MPIEAVMSFLLPAVFRCCSRLLLMLALQLASVCHAMAAETFTVQIQGEKAGQLVVESQPGGYTARFSYRNNGRGPDIEEQVSLSADGQPVQLRIRGRSTYGAEIREDFRLESGRAVWDSAADKGDEAAAPGYLFVPLESSPAYSGAMVMALLARKPHLTSSVGGAQLALEVLASLKVTPAGADAPAELQLVAVTGADTQAWFFWVQLMPGLADGKAARHRFIGLSYPGWAVLRKGFEPFQAQLADRVTQAQDERLLQLRRRHAQALQGITVLRNVRWFDAPAARMRGPADVWLHQGLVTAVTPPGALSVKPQQEIDGTGRSLLPGLWDMHAHIWSGALVPQLAGGVLNVREMGGTNEEVQRLMQRVLAAELPGPAIHPMGFIEGKSQYSSRSGVVVDTLDKGLQAVDDYAARGYLGIKLYNSIRPEWVKPLTQRAHERGMHVAGHVPAFMRAEDAVRAGFDELTHINQVMLNFVVRPGDDTRTLLRFERVGADGWKLNIRSPQSQAFLKLMQQRRTALDLTLFTFEAMFTQQQGQINPSLLDLADHLPVLWRRSLRVPEMELAGQTLKTYRNSWQRMLQLTRALHQAGLVLVPGTDGTPGLGLHRELAIYVEAGIPAGEALRAATWNSAKLARQSGSRGKIERGYAAELVLVDGDPTSDIKQLRRTSLVIQGNVAYSPAALYESLGMKPFAPAAVIQRTAP